MLLKVWQHTKSTHKVFDLTPASSSWRQHLQPSIKTQQVLAHFHITYCHWHRGLSDDYPGIAGEATIAGACNAAHSRWLTYAWHYKDTFGLRS